MMIIKKIEYQHIQSERKEPFVIATGSTNIAHNIVVKVITDEGFGLGSACPSSVTKETWETIMMSLRIFSDELVGEDANEPERINEMMDSLLEKNPSAKAGVDLALYDLKGKIQGQPVFEFLGKKKDKIITDMTIGIMEKEAAVKHALEYQKRGFRALKVKIGLQKDEDVKRIKAVRDAVGQDMIIRVDANQGYDVKSAIEVLNKIDAYNIEQVEQPVKWDDIRGLREVTRNSPIPTTADEAVKTKEDAQMVIESGAAHKINIKLMKCGGLTKALEINRIAKENKIETMIGCMSENRFSISAGLHFALSQSNVKYADLDSHFSLINHNTRGGFEFKAGFLVPVKNAGFGVELTV